MLSCMALQDTPERDRRGGATIRHSRSRVARLETDARIVYTLSITSPDSYPYQE